VLKTSRSISCVLGREMLGINSRLVAHDRYSQPASWTRHQVAGIVWQRVCVRRPVRWRSVLSYFESNSTVLLGLPQHQVCCLEWSSYLRVANGRVIFAWHI
jgi:hypothetical protein